MDETTGLRLDVLGDLVATRDGAPVALGGRRQRSVLAMLVIARGAPVSADRLADGVWGDAPPANTAGALQSYISHLRRRLEPDVGARARDGVIASVRTGYVLRVGPEAVDAWRFDQAVEQAAELADAAAVPVLEGALRLWRGPAYAEYAGEPWALTETVRLEELRAVARERLLEARLAIDKPALLVPELEALVAEDPFREDRWRLLVLALYRAQRQADALAAVRRARDTLAEALGVDPGPALRALEQEILAQSPELDAPRPPAPVHAVPVGSGPSDTGLLVDRDRELATLRRVADDLRAGSGGLAMIQGPPGIGKTRLLLEATQLALAADVKVLSARGSHAEGAHGFGVVRQLFEEPVLDPASRSSLLVGAAAGAAGVFDLSVGEGHGEGEFAVLHGLYWLTVNLAASGPVLVAIDDVQWCDASSLRWLSYLARRLSGLPVTVVLTRRTGEPHPDDTLLTELVLDPHTTLLEPSPLSVDAARAIVAERLGVPAEPFVAACHQTTSGNPLLLRQLLRALESEGVPPDVAHTDTVRAVGTRAVANLVLLRLRRMSPEALAAARAVAVLGDDADLPTVASLSEMPEKHVARVLDVLGRSEILRPGDPLLFVHPLVRDAVYDDIAVTERSLLHERAASVLEARGANVDLVAGHLLHAPRRGHADAVAQLRAAASRAVARGASDSAVVLLRRALDEPAREGPDRTDLLIDLGTVEMLVDGPAAVAHLTEAYADLDDPARRAMLATAIARTHVFTSPAGVATAFARAAAAALPEDLIDARQGLIGLQRITGFMHGLPPAEYREEPCRAPLGTGDGARMLAASLAWERLLDGTDRAGAAELAQFALEGDRLLEIDDGLLWVVAAIVLVLADVELGDFWDRALTRARATGSLLSVMSVNLWRGFDQWRHGHLEDALQSLGDADEQQRMWRASGLGAAYVAAWTSHVHLDRGDVDAAAEVLRAARSLPDLGDGTRLLRQAATRLLIEQGRPGDALETLASARDRPEIVNPVWTPWRRLTARAMAALDRPDEAATLLDDEIRLLRRWGAPTALGPALRLRGEVAGATGAALLREAVEELSSTGAGLELAAARLALGRCPAVEDDEAVPLLREALIGATACGAGPLARAAAEALASRGHDAAAVVGPATPPGPAQAALKSPTAG